MVSRESTLTSAQLANFLCCLAGACTGGRSPRAKPGSAPSAQADKPSQERKTRVDIQHSLDLSLSLTFHFILQGLCERVDNILSWDILRWFCRVLRQLPRQDIVAVGGSGLVLLRVETCGPVVSTSTMLDTISS